MSGHTKGPWKTYQDGVHPVLEGGSNGNESFAICQCFGPDKAFNARLISAAPDMFDALKMVMQHGRIDDSESRMNMVAKAITKAEGRI